MSPRIEPRVLKGFRDFLPEMESRRANLTHALEKVFKAFGFVPIDTPVLEYSEILLGKGGGETDKQVYRFIDHGGRDVALRYDLTVPFARFMAEHVDELYLPFRRYHIAKVWRGENTQRGRYREFVQCDFDIVGTDSASADCDTILVIAEAMRALKAGDVRIRINHRQLFNRFLAAQGIDEHAVFVLRTVDKMEKIGLEQTEKLLAEELGPDQAGRIMAYVTAGSRKDAGFTEVLATLRSLCLSTDPEADQAAKRLEDVHSMLTASGKTESVILDPSITRGLDYYTGIVFETTLASLPGIGSVCSGGRYNELASLYTSRLLPGVGASVGLDRLMAALDELGALPNLRFAPLVLIMTIDETSLPAQHALACHLRDLEIPVEVYPESKKPLVQYSYAEKKGIPFTLALTSSDSSAPRYDLRELSSRTTVTHESIESLCQDLNSRRARSEY